MVIVRSTPVSPLSGDTVTVPSGNKLLPSGVSTVTVNEAPASTSVGIIENVIDVNGKKEVRHGNKSSLVLMKLSIIESLIKFYSSNLGKKYPFIGDNFQASFDESTELAHLNKLNETFDQSIIIAKDHEHLRKLKGQKGVSIGILKWEPPIEDEGVTTIKML